MRVREVKIEDLDDVLSLLYQLSPSKENESPKEGDLEDILKSIIESEDQKLYVLEDDGKVVGTATLLVQRNLSHGGRPYGHIENVVIDSEHREEDLGKEIVSRAIEKAKERGCYKAVLSCERDLVPFYEKCGLQKTNEVQMRTDFG